MPSLGIIDAVFPSLCSSSVPGCSGSGSGCAGAGPGQHWGSLQGPSGLLDSEHHSALSIILFLAAPDPRQCPARLFPGATGQLGKRKQCFQHREGRGWSLRSLVFPGWVVGPTHGWAPWALIQVSGTHYLEPHTKAVRVVTLCFRQSSKLMLREVEISPGSTYLPVGALGFQPCLGLRSPHHFHRSTSFLCKGA